MPEDLELIWTNETAYVYPVTAEGREFLAAAMPQRLLMRIIPLDGVGELCAVAFSRGLTVGGVNVRR